MKKFRTIAGVLFFLLSVQFMIGLMVGEAMAPNYVVHDNAISDLGIIPETSALFTISLVTVGLLNIAGGYLFFRDHGKRGTLAVYVLAGIGAMGAGAISLNDPSGLHGLFALIAFLFFNAQAIVSGLLVNGPMKAISIAAGLIGLAFLFMHFLSDANIMDLYGPIGHGGSERMIVYPAILWLIGYSGYLMATPGPEERST